MRVPEAYEARNRMNAEANALLQLRFASGAVREKPNVRKPVKNGMVNEGRRWQALQSDEPGLHFAYLGGELSSHMYCPFCLGSFPVGQANLAHL